MITGLKFISIPVRDQARAVAFWTRNFGFTVASEQPFDDSRTWIELRIPGTDSRLVLFTATPAEVRAGFPTVTFTADDLARTYDELRTRGVEFESPPRRTDWGSSVVFKDPEGNSFRLASS